MGAAPSIRCDQSPGERHDARLSGACACGNNRRHRRAAGAPGRRAVAAAGAGRAAAAEHDAAHRLLAAGPVPRRLAALVTPPLTPTQRPPPISWHRVWTTLRLLSSSTDYSRAVLLPPTHPPLGPSAVLAVCADGTGAEASRQQQPVHRRNAARISTAPTFLLLSSQAPP